MSEYDLGTVIARREFDCGESKVFLEIGQPYPLDEGKTSFCPFRITGLGNGRVRRAGGVDSVQALYCTMQKAAADLYCSDEAREKRLTLDGRRNLMLPVLDAIADLVPKDDE
ncbi:MAG: hypothetical protein WCA81_03090 [Rhizomicrobium sp.]